MIYLAYLRAIAAETTYAAIGGANTAAPFARTYGSLPLPYVLT